MGCGQSKINLYPRRSKGTGKGAHNGKKTASGDSTKDGSEDEEAATAGGAGAGATGSAGGAGASATGSAGGAGAGATGAASTADAPSDAGIAENGAARLFPLPVHPSSHVEISASQQDFFKILDMKIESGKDYDSQSDTEVVLESERKMALIRQWESTSQSSSLYHSSSPPTPRRRTSSQDRTKAPTSKSPNPNVRKCLKQQQARQMQAGDNSSPPQRRNLIQYQPQDDSEKPNQANGGQKWPQYDNIPSPPRRPPSGSTSWKSNPKVAPYGPKTPKRSQEIAENQKSREPSYSTPRDASQITYNPTFQSHSPSHTAQTKPTPCPQPYIAQILTYPMTQPSPTYQNQKYISPQQTYHEQPSPPDIQTFPQRAQVLVQHTVQPSIYFISQGNVASNQQDGPISQKQQTALHLQQYVAMKQAQQTMFGYVPKNPPVEFPPHAPITELSEDSYVQGYYAGYHSSTLRSHSAPVVRSAVQNSPVMRQPSPNLLITQNVQFSPIVGQMSPLVGQIAPITAIGQISSMPGPFPQTEVQYYQHVHSLQGRPASATLNRYQKDTFSAPASSSMTNSPQNNPTGLPKGNMCQSLNIVTQKTVGEIVPIGDKDLGVYQSKEPQVNSLDSNQVSTLGRQLNSDRLGQVQSSFDRQEYMQASNHPRQAYYSQAVGSDLNKSDSSRLNSGNTSKYTDIRRSQDTDEYV